MNDLNKMTGRKIDLINVNRKILETEQKLMFELRRTIIFR